MNSSFFKRKIINQENKIVKKFIDELNSDKKNVELSNKVKNLKNVNQGIYIKNKSNNLDYFLNLSKNASIEFPKNLKEKFNSVRNLFLARNCSNSLKKIEDNRFVEMENSLNSYLKENNENEEEGFDLHPAIKALVNF